eukprot:GHVN01104100.1.p1 GENE.GHVN01104100.1~~GHVN01104100.1.p1  ORF type:complete len:717 (+),score=151.61 GHVN01104100.1:112-2151(+)
MMTRPPLMADASQVYQTTAWSDQNVLPSSPLHCGWQVMGHDSRFPPLSTTVRTAYSPHEGAWVASPPYATPTSPRYPSQSCIAWGSPATQEDHPVPLRGTGSEIKSTGGPSVDYTQSVWSRNMAASRPPSHPNQILLQHHSTQSHHHHHHQDPPNNGGRPVAPHTDGRRHPQHNNYDNDNNLNINSNNNNNDYNNNINDNNTNCHDHHYHNASPQRSAPGKLSNGRLRSGRDGGGLNKGSGNPREQQTARSNHTEGGYGPGGDRVSGMSGARLGLGRHFDKVKDEDGRYDNRLQAAIREKEKNREGEGGARDHRRGGRGGGSLESRWNEKPESGWKCEPYPYTTYYDEDEDYDTESKYSVEEQKVGENDWPPGISSTVAEGLLDLDVQSAYLVGGEIPRFVKRHVNRFKGRRLDTCRMVWVRKDDMAEMLHFVNEALCDVQAPKEMFIDKLDGLLSHLREYRESDELRAMRLRVIEAEKRLEEAQDEQAKKWIDENMSEVGEVEGDQEGNELGGDAGGGNSGEGDEKIARVANNEVELDASDRDQPKTIYEAAQRISRRGVSIDTHCVDVVSTMAASEKTDTSRDCVGAHSHTSLLTSSPSSSVCDGASFNGKLSGRGGWAPSPVTFSLPRLSGYRLIGSRYSSYLVRCVGPDVVRCAGSGGVTVGASESNVQAGYASS